MGEAELRSEIEHVEKSIKSAQGYCKTWLQESLPQLRAQLLKLKPARTQHAVATRKWN